MPKRVPFTRRSSTAVEVVTEATTQGVKAEDEAAAKDGAPAGQAIDATNDSSVKNKGAGSVSKQTGGDDAKDDEGSRKSKGSKRRNNSAEGDDGTGNGVVDSGNSSSKRRRKTENGNT
jgi:hypothetical protein